VSNFYVKWVES